jgi:hypothetical protein
MIIASGRREPPGSELDSIFAWLTSSTNCRSLTSSGMTTFSSLASLVGTTEVVP